MPLSSRMAAVRREIAALGRADLDVLDLHTHAIELVGRVVPYDATCWASTDPVLMVPTGSLTIDFDPTAEQEALFVDIETDPIERHTFAELTDRRIAVARLSDLPHRDRARSRRFNELYQALAVRHEVRMCLFAGEFCWGVAGLMRGPGRDFTEDEAEFLASIAPALGAATRAATRRRARVNRLHDANGGAGPVVLLIDKDYTVTAATPAAQAWMAAGPERLLPAVQLAAAHRDSGLRVRVHSRVGGWSSLAAAPLVESDGHERILVTVEPASAAEISEVMFPAFGLTARERDVCREVLAGRSSRDIGAALFISVHTVQDHLKSIFAKVGVSSRRELAAALGIAY